MLTKEQINFIISMGICTSAVFARRNQRVADEMDRHSGGAFTSEGWTALAAGLRDGGGREEIKLTAMHDLHLYSARGRRGTNPRSMRRSAT
jgi:hypothetical protein